MESTYFLIVLGVVFAAILLKWVASPAHKGSRIKRAVHGVLRQSLRSSDYAVLRDVVLRGADGVVRIDHVVVSRFGIFVIEARDLPGWIIGSEKDSHWTRSLDDTRTEFPNPLNQGQAHVRSLQALLGLRATRFHPLVVFPDKSEFWKPMPLNVIKLDRLLAFIEVRNTQLMSLDEAARAVATIESSQLDPETAFETPRLESLRGRRAGAAPAASAAMDANGAGEPSRTLFGGRRTTRALAGLASVALLLAIANVLVGGFDGWRTIGGAWPTAAGESPAGQVHPSRPGSSQPAAANFDPAELRCGYSVEIHRCACFDPAGVKVPMEYEACKALADESAR